MSIGFKMLLLFCIFALFVASIFICLFRKLNFHRIFDKISNDSKSESTENSTITEQPPVSQSWCHTKSVQFAIEHTWTVEDFSMYLAENVIKDYSAITSSRFCSPAHEHITFHIALYPKGEFEECKNHLSIFLWTHFDDEKLDLRTQFKLSLIDQTGKMSHNQGFKYKPTTKLGHGWKKFLACSVLLDSNSGLLPDDKLTIRCEVRVSIERYKISSNDQMSGIKSQIHENSLSADLKTLLDKGIHSDVLLVIGSTQYSAHKNILSARSPVFEAMFARENTKENAENRVEITDIQVETFQELLNYIYSGQVPKKVKLTMDLLIAADKYQVDALKSACEEALSSELDVKTVTSILVLADMHNAGKLKVKCIQYITGHSTEVMLTESWEKLFKSRPDLALQTYRDLAVQRHKK